MPTAASIGHFWGTGESTHVVGEDFKPLPDRLDIRFFSFTENKLYQGSFDLPYERILALFKEGIARDKESPIFNRMMVGVAPGGAVAVWVRARGETREVFFGQAEPYEDDLFDITQRKINDRDDYVRRNIIEMIGIEKLADIEKNGVPFGLWEKYRTPYKWATILRTEKKLSNDTKYSFLMVRVIAWIILLAKRC